YVAKAKLKHLNKYMPVSLNNLEDYDDAPMDWTEPVTYEPVFRLGDSFAQSIHMLKQVEALCSEFPGLDCGACGAPTCRALAEDIVRGDATKDYCIPILKGHIHTLSNNYMELLDNINEADTSKGISIDIVRNYIQNLIGEISLDPP
ncbi:MAG: (Fe-S)-binding protein, partial [Catenibacillus sp.]